MISSYLELAIFCVTGLRNNDVDFACLVTVLHIQFKSEPSKSPHLVNNFLLLFFVPIHPFQS